MPQPQPDPEPEVDPLPDEDPTEQDAPPPMCDTEQDVTLFLSPDDSNSTSSPVQAREAVLGEFSSLSAIAPIRPWEFMNYYTFDYPPPEAGGVQVSTSLLHPEAAADGEFTLQIAVTSPFQSTANRPPISITLVLDTSGSMGGHPIEMLKATCRAIAGSLREGDTISMVTWDTTNQIVLGGHHVSGPNDEELLQHVESLSASGGTDLHGGLTAGYDLALQHFEPGRVNRIVLVSDGGANVGITDVETIAQHAGSNDEDGIYMVGVGVGDAGTYNDELMDTVTDVGKGASVFINDAQEADKMFGVNFLSTFSVAARDVQVRLDMPPGFEVVRFSGEEISTDPAEIEPQHLAFNDSMVFHQTIETCAPEGLDNETLTVTVSYLDGQTFERREVSHELAFTDLLAAPDDRLLKGAAVFAYAEALAACQASTACSTTEAVAALEAAKTARPNDPELDEIAAVLSRL